MGIPGEPAIRRRSGHFATATAALAALMALAVAISIARTLAAPAQDQPELSILHGIYWMPTFFYLWAALAIRRTFSDVAKGAIFAPAVATGLRRVGWALILGGALNSITIRIVQSASLPRGFSFGDAYAFRGTKVDAAYFTLVIVGLALLLLGRVLQAAAELQQRSERLQAELDEFF